MRCDVHNENAGDVHALQRSVPVASSYVLPVVRQAIESEAPVASVRKDDAESDAKGVEI